MGLQRSLDKGVHDNIVIVTHLVLIRFSAVVISTLSTFSAQS